MPRKADPNGKAGGKRQGTPGKAYSNRTDLQTNMSPSDGMNTPASGGIEPPKAPQTPQRPPIYADDFPNLKDPTTRPGIPTAQGLPSGLGAGPQGDTRREDARRIKKWLPVLEPLANDPDVPNSVRTFVNFIRSV